MAEDTRASSAITDHPFKPRTTPNVTGFIPAGATSPRWVEFPPSPYLCQRCNLAEAAHRETTVKR